MVDLGSVSVLGPVNSKSPGQASELVKKTKKSTPYKSSSFNKDLMAFDQKWSERLSRLEALIVAKTLEKLTNQPTFQQASPSHLPSAGAVSDTPFLLPTRLSEETDTDQDPALQMQFPSTSATRSPLPQEELDLEPEQIQSLSPDRLAEERESNQDTATS